MIDHSPDGKTVELWLRAFDPMTAGPAHDRALEFADRLETRDSIDSVRVGVWGRAFQRTDRVRSIPQLERIETTIASFETWADRTGRQLEPFFRTRHVESKLTGETFEICRLPSIALAEYRGGNVVHVAPSRDGDRTIDVLDRLEALVCGEATDPTLAFDDSSDRSADEQPRRYRRGYPR